MAKLMGRALQLWAIMDSGSQPKRFNGQADGPCSATLGIGSLSYYYLVVSMAKLMGRALQRDDDEASGGTNDVSMAKLMGRALQLSPSQVVEGKRVRKQFCRRDLKNQFPKLARRKFRANKSS